MPAHSHSFVGRQQEMGVLQRTLAEARAGPSPTVLVLGDPGVGKTALVASFLAANPATTHIWVSGSADETTVRFGVVDQFRRLAGRERPHRIGGEDGSSAGTELVDIVDAVRAPVLVLVVDDLHWVDAESRRALLFLLRRLPRRGVLVVCTAPPEADHVLGRAWARVFTAPYRSLRLHLPGLDAGEVRQLALQRERHLSRSAARRLRDHTDGNPLHVTALLEELTGAILNDPTSSLPAPRSYAARVHARVALLSPQARSLVAATAVLGVRAPLRVVLSTAGSGVAASAVDEVVAHRLLVDEVRAGVRELSFPRPLTRAAVYHGLSPSRRSELRHAAARCALEEERVDGSGFVALEQLTERERAVVGLIRRGLTNREIAAALFVSTKTIEYHVHNVFDKLGLHTRRELWWVSDLDGPVPDAPGPTEGAQTGMNVTSRTTD